MKIIAVIPIKLNNQRLPGKNIKLLSSGQPLCSMILNTFLQVPQIDEVYVYCSDEAIIDYIPKGVTFLKRSTELDTNTCSMTEVLKRFAHDVEADIYIMSHVTAPFVTVESIQKGLNAIIDEKYDSAFSVKKVQDFMWREGQPMNYKLDNIPRTQDLEPFYMETSGFYAYEKSVIIEKGRRIGDKPFLVEVGEIESIDIDEEEDFIIADAIVNFQRRS